MVRPDTYIGSVERTTDKMWVFNPTSESMEYREISFVPGLYKIFDEILVNAADNKQNDKNMSEIRVTVDRETGVISIMNDGRGIPIEIHKVSFEIQDCKVTRIDMLRNTASTYQK
jgi:DNA topoisomerase-2